MTASVIYFSDNDLLLKLETWNLREEALSLLNARESDICILDTYRMQLRNGKRKWVTNYGQETMTRALRFAERVQVVGDAFSPTELARLVSVVDLDDGEAVLFAATANVATFRVATGDKRCLYALHRATDCWDIAERLRGNVLHLEQVMHRLVEANIRPIRAAVQKAPHVDMAVTGAFGQNFRNNSDDVCASLRNSIRQLHTDCGGLLDLSDTERDPFADT